MEHKTERFFDRVLSDKGFPVIVSLKKGSAPQTKVLDNLHSFHRVKKEEVVRCAKEGRELYFGISTLKERFVTDAGGVTRTRVGANCLETRALVLDVDIDPSGLLKGKEDKPCYKTQEEAIEGINRLCTAINFNTPYIVSSGYGLHCYWPFEHAVSSEEWATLANRFKAACLFAEPLLVVDRSRVADRAGILRVPHSYNFRNAQEPKQVMILHECGVPVWPYKFYAEHLDSFAKDNDLEGYVEFLAKPANKNKPIVNLALDYGDAKFPFKKLFKECNWVNDYMKNRATAGYQAWWAMVNLSVHCSLTIDAGKPYLGKVLNYDKPVDIEGFDLAKYVSQGHADYDEAKVYKKFEDSSATPALSARTCVNLQSINSKACEGCPYRDVVRSPLGIARVSKPVEKLEVSHPVIVEGAEIGTENVELPKPPFPYDIGEDGGIYKRIKDQATGTRLTSQLIYEYTLLPVRRIRDEATGMESIEFEVRLPHEEIKRFVLPSGLLQDSKTLGKELAQRGVYVVPKLMIELVDYVIKYIQIIQRVDAVNSNYTAFGWKDTTIGLPKFALYDCIITPNGVKAYKNTSRGLEEYGKCASAKGEIEKWKEAFNIYNDVAGMEPHIINLMLSFGAPLLHFLDQFGFLFNLHGPTGRGKSSSLALATSVWGYPQASFLTSQDTGNALYVKLGLMNNLPVTYDEITDIKPEEISDLAYKITMGRGRDALDRDRNLKHNQPRWQTCLLTTSNNSLYAKLALLGSGNNAQGYRVLEYNAPQPSKVINEKMHIANDVIKENHGIAGRIYMQYILANYDQVRAQVREAVRNLADRDRSRERFWAAAQAIIQVGGYISKKLGLHDYEPGMLMDYMRDNAPREQVEAIVGDPVSKLNDYFLQNISNTIREFDDQVVNLELEYKGVPNIAVRLQGHHGQIEKAYVPVDNFKRWCKNNNVDFTWLRSELQESKILIRTVKKRIGAGTKYFSLAANCMELDMQHSLITGKERGVFDGMVIPIKGKMQ